MASLAASSIDLTRDTEGNVHHHRVTWAGFRGSETHTRSISLKGRVPSHFRGSVWSQSCRHLIPCRPSLISGHTGAYITRSLSLRVGVGFVTAQDAKRLIGILAEQSKGTVSRHFTHALCSLFFYFSLSLSPSFDH